MERVAWDSLEIALLVEACEKVNKGLSNKASVVKEMSILLRQRAIDLGHDIDSYFRNENGISLQMTKMDYFLSDGKKGLIGGSADFERMANLYKTHRVIFKTILSEAHKQVKNIKISTTTFSNNTQSNNKVVNFYEKEDYVNTKPVFYRFYGCEEYVDSWSKLYTSIITKLIEKFPDIIKPVLFFGKARRIDLGTNSDFQAMVQPYKIKENMILELNLSANSIVRKIKFALELVDIDLENIYIEYNKKVKSGSNMTKKMRAITYAEMDRLEDLSKWMSERGMAENTVNNYLSAIKSADIYAKSNEIKGVNVFSDDYLETINSIDILMSNPEFIKYNARQHNRFSAAFRKLKEYLEERIYSEKHEFADKDMELRHNKLYRKLHSVSVIYDDPSGLTVPKIMNLVGMTFSEADIIEILDSVSWAVKIDSDKYTFSKASCSEAKKVMQNTMVEKVNAIPTDFNKDEFVNVLMTRYQNGMRFDSIDFEIFRDTYSDLYNGDLNFSDDELECRLRLCGIYYKDMLFPAEGIIDKDTSEKLFSYIDSKLKNGTKALYYKAIYEELEDIFEYCFALENADMLKEYIKFIAPNNKYYFHKDFMSKDKDISINFADEVIEFMLSAGKPLSYDEVYTGLPHIPRDKILKEIRSNSVFVRNEKSHYFHVDIFEVSNDELEKVKTIIKREIDENGYALWSKISNDIRCEIPDLFENNVYLTDLGIREVLSKKLNDVFCFASNVISYVNKGLSMADLYRLYAKKHRSFTSEEIYEFSKETNSVIFFWVLNEESVRVNQKLFVSKDQVNFDVDLIDKALESYIADDFIFIKDIDSFLLFPNTGYEWNEFLLESFLMRYSKKFCLLNNGTSLNNVAGAVAKRNGKFTDFVDVCAYALANSGVELNKTASINYLAEVNLITRRSYKEIDVAMTKARQIRGRKE